MEALKVFEKVQIEVQPGIVKFDGFEKLKQEALQLAEMIEQVEVTDENIQTSKKLLAAVNKRTKEIEDRRIAIKKEILEPYDKFEKQVKEIISIVKEANDVVRQQVRELEEREREEKRQKIKEIFDKRIKHYSFGDVFTFDHFITPKHLNKSVSIKSVEEQMVEWLEKKDQDMKVINSLHNKHDVLMEYLDTKDLSVAINIVNEREQRKREMEQKEREKKAETIKQSFIIRLSDEKDCKLVEMFMTQNNIDYTLEKVVI